MSRLEDIASFVDQARASATADDLRRLMESITFEMGFTAYSLYQHVRRWDWQKTETLALSNYPKPWIERFFEREFNQFDPVLRAAQRTGVGFKWADIPTMIPLTSKQIRVLETGRREGIEDGFTVPCHIPGEWMGSCSFVVGTGKALPEGNLTMAHVVGGYGYEAARQLRLRRIGIVRRKDPVRLSPRQLDCLALVADGKTDWEIATVLGIKESTVNGYIDETKVALGVTRRSQLVMRALFEGHLALSDTVQ